MGLPPRPPPLSSDPRGKPAIQDHLVENARRASLRARAEGNLCRRIQRVVNRMEARAEGGGGGLRVRSRSHGGWHEE